MKTLTIIGRAHGETALRIVEEFHKDGDEVAILFIGRGTHHTARNDVIKQLDYAELYTMEPEFNSTDERITALTYDEIIDLLEKCERTFTWI
jgi:hypothetical protein